MGERNPDPKLAALEEQMTGEANQLGIGPMGFGGKTTVLDTKITGLSACRPASLSPSPTCAGHTAGAG